MWLLLSQLSRGKLQPMAPDIRPLDTLIEQITTSPEVLCFLAPLPSTKREASDHADTPGPKQPKPSPGGPSATTKPTPRAADQPAGATNWRKVPQGCQRKGTNGWRCLKFQWGLCNRQKENKCKFGVHECFKCGAKRPYNQCEH